MAYKAGLIFGPNGVGKGTLAYHLAQEYGLSQINMGNILREWVVKNNLKDLQIKIDEGDFVEDNTVDLTLHMHFEHEKSSNTLRNIIVEGIPRKRSQVEFFSATLREFDFECNWVIVLNAPLEEIIERVSQRVTAPDGTVYHLKYNPPPKDIPREKLMIRPDDRPDIVKKRYESFMVDTIECLSDPFFADIPTVSIDGLQTIDKVFQDATDFINKL